MAVKERFLLCSMDQPEYSNAWLPAVVSRGHLRCAVSTSGTAPALASRLRQDMEEIFDDTFQSFLEWLSSVRKRAGRRGGWSAADLLPTASGFSQRNIHIRKWLTNVATA
jgi:siroheme synthase-like protein